MEPAGRGRVERRLAAILAADVAGYSRLIEADEEGTLGRLKALRAEVIDPKIALHRGRIVKTTGDGLLVEFASVVDGLRCAAEIQAAMAESNAPLPADKRIDLRIGINVGDILVEDGDIFGDGVNVAARLEGLADPGGICVSARVREDATGKIELAFRDMGEQQLRNIARPVRVYSVGATMSPMRSRRRRIGTTGLVTAACCSGSLLRVGEGQDDDRQPGRQFCLDAGGWWGCSWKCLGGYCRRAEVRPGPPRSCPNGSHGKDAFDASISCAFILTWLPERRTLPSSTYRTPSVHPGPAGHPQLQTNPAQGRRASCNRAYPGGHAAAAKHLGRAAA
jgi:class 3 adenylate cyclase